MTRKKTRKLNKRFLETAKFEANEQFTQSALDNLTEENAKLIKSLRKPGEIDQID